jgi:pimeloyl-ACP methyl ester carboxylesterase
VGCGFEYHGESLKNLRTYGKAPFNIAVVHGGPGGGGEMAPVARELASGWGVLEPLQTATSLEGQVKELRTVLENHGDLPVTLIGFSWGAWLSFIVAAHYPTMVKKLILVGAGPYEENYVPRLQEIRLSRLSEEERTAFEFIISALGDPATEDKDTLLTRLRALAFRTDAYDPIIEEPQGSSLVGIQGDIFHGVWKDAAEMRRSGRLLELGKQIECPVVAIHGDYDPHPAEGVQKPLPEVLERFRFILLKNCGHMPWIERQARDAFYRTLEQELH